MSDTVKNERLSHIFSAFGGAAVAGAGVVAAAAGTAAGTAVGLGVGTAVGLGVGLGAVVAGVGVVAAFGLGAGGADLQLDFKPHTAFTGAVFVLATVFGAEAYDVRQNNILIPVNDNIREAIEIGPANKDEITKLGEDAIYDFVDNVISVNAQEQAKQDYCDAADRLGYDVSKDCLGTKDPSLVPFSLNN